jgi:hypothetical protein
MLRALNVATPAAATADVVPPSVQFEVMTMVSVEPVPAVATLPLTSSTPALNVASIIDATVSVAGGATVKATCVGAPARMFIAVLVAVASVLVVSVATN